MATIIVFSSSLFLILVLILIKSAELRTGRKNLVLGIISRLDSKSAKLVSFLKFKTLQLIQTVRYLVLVKSREILRDFFYRMEERLVNEYKSKRGAIIMGRREILNKGSVSFYLKKITEEKGSVGRGKIE